MCLFKQLIKAVADVKAVQLTKAMSTNLPAAIVSTVACSGLGLICHRLIGSWTL